MTDCGHGWVYTRLDGVKARCGGPGICSECSRDKARKEAAENRNKPSAQNQAQAMEPATEAHHCNCLGPQNGQPHCPCTMRTLRIVDGRYVQDMGPVEPARPALNLWQNTRGCICPPGSEATCQGALCPRRPHTPAVGAI